MIVFYDPNNGNQVMAVYSHDTESTVWTDRGYLRAKVEQPSFQTSITRDRQVSVVGGVVEGHWASPNHIQPARNPVDIRLAELDQKLKNRTATIGDVMEIVAAIRGV